MTVLVVSDSHSALSYMRQWARLLRPQTIIHLGDYYADGEALGRDWPHCALIQVPGNCDRHWMTQSEPEIRVVELEGARVYLTHGHRHGVKSSPYGLLADAQAAGADVALFGHTHEAVLWQTEAGMWVMNPGSCGSYSGSVGLLELENGQVTQCRVLHAEDMEEFA